MGRPDAPTLMIVTDAIRGDYPNPEDAPFLSGLRETCSHARRLRPNFGFCERSEFFTGTRPDVNGYLGAMTLGPGSDFSRIETRLFRLFDVESPALRPHLRRLMRGWFRRVRGISQPIYEIPVRQLSRFALTEDRFDFFTDLGHHCVETLFDVCAREGRRVCSEPYVSLRFALPSDQERIERLERACSEGFDFLPLYIGAGDAVGHRFGPESPERHAMMRRVDAQVERAVTRFREAHPQGRFVIYGDHGMVAVERTLDVQTRLRGRLRGSGLRAGRDFEAWFDSTMLRLWFFNGRARELLSQWAQEDEVLGECGEVLTAGRCAELHVPAPGTGQGDLLWLARPGVLVFPDHFHRERPCLGMHGYETQVDAQKSFAIWHHPDFARHEVDEIEGVDICPLLCDLLAVPAPAQCQGRSPLAP